MSEPWLTEIVVLVEEVDHPGPSVDFGRALALRLDLPQRNAHVIESTEPGDDFDDLVDDLVSSLQTGSMAILESAHATRWSGKHSVAEHVVDEWGGHSVVIGARCAERQRWAADGLADGPLLVALDGSESAERALPPARRLAAALGLDLVLARVVAEAEPQTGHDAAVAYLDDVAGGAETTMVVGSNDPIRAIGAAATEGECSMVVLASKGDRSVQRRTMSRMSSGLVSELPLPIMIVGHSVTE